MDTTFNYVGQTSGVANLGAAVGASSQASIWDAIKANDKTATTFQTQENTLKVRENAAIMAAQQESQRALMAIKEKQDALRAKGKEFQDSALGTLESEEFNSKIDNLSAKERAQILDNKIKENIVRVSKGEISQAYAEKFNANLHPALKDAFKQEQVDFDRESVNSGSLTYSTLTPDKKKEFISHLRAQGVSEDSVKMIPILGNAKYVDSKISEFSTMISKSDITSPDTLKSIEAFKIGIEQTIQNTKILISESGKDPESTPQIKQLLTKLDLQKNELTKIENQGASMYVNSLNGDGSIMGSYNIAPDKIDITTFTKVYNNDIVSAQKALNTYSEKYNEANKTRDMIVNESKYTLSEKLEMQKTNKAYKEYISTDVTTKLDAATLKGDYETVTSLITHNPSIAKDTYGVDLMNKFTVAADRNTPDSPEKSRSMREFFSTVSTIKDMSNGRSALITMFGEANTSKFLKIEEAATYMFGGNYVLAAEKVEEFSSKPLNRDLQKDVKTLMENELKNSPIKDEITNSIYMLNTLNSNAMTKEVVKDLIEKHNNIDDTLESGIVIHNNGGIYNKNHRDIIDKDVSLHYPGATSIVVTKNNVHIKGPSGDIAVLRMDKWNDMNNDAIKILNDKAIEEGKSLSTQALNIGITTISKGYEGASIIGREISTEMNRNYEDWSVYEKIQYYNKLKNSAELYNTGTGIEISQATRNHNAIAMNLLKVRAYNFKKDYIDTIKLEKK